MHNTTLDLMFKNTHNADTSVQNRIQKPGKWSVRLNSHRVQCTVHAAIGLVFCELRS